MSIPIFTPPPQIEAGLHRALAELEARFERTDVATRGAIWHPTWNLPNATHGGSPLFAFACGLSAVLAWSRGEPERAAERIDDAVLALDFVTRSLRPSDLPDLLDCNFESAPDAGFTTQEMVALLDVLPKDAEAKATFAPLERAIRALVERFVPGLIDGGFHTPNHRWVLASGLLLAARVLPGHAKDCRAMAQRYLDEGIDIDGDGFYIERSPLAYDAVTNRSLTIIAAESDSPEALDAVRRNLLLDEMLLHHDGTAETALSHRQDFGKREAPLALVPVSLMLAAQSDEHATTAMRLAERFGQHMEAMNPRERVWMAWCWMRHGERLADIQPDTSSFEPFAGVACLEDNGVLRQRTGMVSATWMQSPKSLLHLVAGKGEIFRMGLGYSWFGLGNFDPQTTNWDGTAFTLVDNGERAGHRPGYELPLGRRVAPTDWESALEERPWRKLPLLKTSLRIEPAEDGAIITWQSEGGCDGVPAGLWLDFACGGRWMMGKPQEDAVLTPEAGDIVFAKGQTTRVCYGCDWIEIEHDAPHQHTMHPFRDGSAPQGCVRWVMSHMTPVQTQIRLRAGRD